MLRLGLRLRMLMAVVVVVVLLRVTGRVVMESRELWMW
jgi:hypothetical protein